MMYIDKGGIASNTHALRAGRLTQGVQFEYWKCFGPPWTGLRAGRSLVRNPMRTCHRGACGGGGAHRSGAPRGATCHRATTIGSVTRATRLKATWTARLTPIEGGLRASACGRPHGFGVWNAELVRSFSWSPRPGTSTPRCLELPGQLRNRRPQLGDHSPVAGRVSRRLPWTRSQQRASARSRPHPASRPDDRSAPSRAFRTAHPPDQPRLT